MSQAQCWHHRCLSDCLFVFRSISDCTTRSCPGKEATSGQTRNEETLANLCFYSSAFSLESPLSAQQWMTTARIRKIGAYGQKLLHRNQVTLRAVGQPGSGQCVRLTHLVHDALRYNTLNRSDRTECSHQSTSI